MPQQLAPGNIDLRTRPRVKNPDGTVSTIRSISINEDGQEILIPTVSDDGRILTTPQAIDLYHRTGKHLGIFRDAASATAAAQHLHQSEAGKLSPMMPPQQERYRGMSLAQLQAYASMPRKRVMSRPIRTFQNPDDR